MKSFDNISLNLSRTARVDTLQNLLSKHFQNELLEGVYCGTCSLIDFKAKIKNRLQSLEIKEENEPNSSRDSADIQEPEPRRSKSYREIEIVKPNVKNRYSNEKEVLLKALKLLERNSDYDLKDIDFIESFIDNLMIKLDINNIHRSAVYNSKASSSLSSFRFVKVKTTQERQKSIVQSPKTLVFHVNRLVHDYQGNTFKLETLVDFPMSFKITNSNT